MSQQKPGILIIDDERFCINVLVDLLKDDYSISVATSGTDGLSRIYLNELPELILLDVLMPDMDGYEVCRRLKEDPRSCDIPIIFLTVKSEIEDEILGFRLGAVDYIKKPISPPIVVARVATHLALKHSKESLNQQNRILEEKILERTREISRTQDVAILCLASLAETRDNETGNHIRRTQRYVQLLAYGLRERGRYSDRLSDEYIDLLFKSAPLHDIGKVGVPDRILLKPGSLDGEDWEEMKRHTRYGVEAIERAEASQGSTYFLKLAKEIAGAHHEKWDGSGYPDGLVGTAIPLSGRLMAVADVYDALITKRVYKPAFSHEKSIQTISEGRGTHFEPDILDVFLELQEDFRDIAIRFADEYMDVNAAAH